MIESDNFIENPLTKMETEEDTQTTKNTPTSEKINSTYDIQGIIQNNQCLILSKPSFILQKRKYVKKSLAQFLGKYLLTKNQVNFDKSQNIMAVPLYESPRDTIEFILIGGDFIFKINTDSNSIYQAKQQYEYALSSYSPPQPNGRTQQSETELAPYKEIIHISKEETFISVKMCNKMDGLRDFRSLIGPINSQMSERTGEDHLEMLLQFQDTMNRQYAAIDRILELCPDRDRLMQQQQRRFEYICKYGLMHTRSKFSEDEFLSAGIWQINFDQKTPVLQSIAFNHAMVSLIGTDFDQLQNFFLRKGLKEFFDFQTRVNLQTHYIRGLVEKRNQLFQQPFTLLTYDDMKIECTAEIETLFLEMPEDLKYCQDENPFDIVEGGFCMHLIVEANQLKDIIQIRNQMIQEEEQRGQSRNQSDIYKKEEDICYNMQAQYFIEKFYQNQLKDILRNSVNSNSGSICEADVQEISNKELEDPLSYARCKYKNI